MQFDKAKIKYPEKKLDNNEKSSRVSAYTEDFKGEYYNLQTEKLIPFKNQARKFFNEDGINALAETIKEHGIRQPLTVLPSSTRPGYYEVVSGERRLRAATLLSLAQVPCIIIQDELKAEEIAIIENVQREDLHPVELMRAFVSLLNNNICKTQLEIAKKVGMPRTAIAEIINLKVLSNEIQEFVIQNNIKARSLFRRLCSTSPEKHQEMLDAYLKQDQEKSIRSLIAKGKVLTIALSGNNFEIMQNKISKLSVEKQKELKGLLSQLI